MDVYRRFRSKHARPKTPAPRTGWVIAELARLAGVSSRRVRYYVEQGIITPSEFRGIATRYQRRELLRLLATLRLRAERRASLIEIRRTLDGWSERELEAWLSTQVLPPTAAAVLGLSSRAHAVQSEKAIDALSKQASTWRRVCLLPGLELAVASDASPAVARAARAICEEYLGASPEQLTPTL